MRGKKNNFLAKDINGIYAYYSGNMVICYYKRLQTANYSQLAESRSQWMDTSENETKKMRKNWGEIMITILEPIANHSHNSDVHTTG